ncbi:hypothetical protein D3C83_267180 [compost metagenome]
MSVWPLLSPANRLLAADSNTMNWPVEETNAEAELLLPLAPATPVARETRNV